MLNQCSIKAAETLQRRGEIQGRLIISLLILLPVTRCHLMHFHLQVLISAVSFTTLIVQKDKTEKSPLAQEKSESESSFFFPCWSSNHNGDIYQHFTHLQGGEGGCESVSCKQLSLLTRVTVHNLHNPHWLFVHLSLRPLTPIKCPIEKKIR